MKHKLFILDIINKSLRGEKYDMDELELMDIARRNLNTCGLLKKLRDDKLTCLIPLNISDGDDRYLYGRLNRDIDTEQYLLGRKPMYVINPITDVSVFALAGAKFFQLGMDAIKIPSFSNIMASWVDDGDEPADDGDEITIGGATFVPKRIFVCLDIPTKMILQGGPEIEKWLGDNITAAIAAKVDATIGGLTASSASKPQGMGYAITTGLDTKENAVVPDLDDLVAMEEAVADLRVPIENFAWITNGVGRRILRKTPYSVDENNYAYQKGKVLDAPAFFSNLIPVGAGADSNGTPLYYGNWKDLGIIQFGAYEIIADPYTLKKQSIIQLNVSTWFDFKGLRGSSPTDAKNGTTQDNDYAFSFTSKAIKSA
ncbi:MAG: phage major capsid protein [Bacteroidia bacterium]|nr:phage major capsid protein [Bacteroidia bacterium]